MGVSGELNLAECGNKVTVFAPESHSIVDIKIGDSFWIIVSKEQAKELKDRLEEVIK